MLIGRSDVIWNYAATFLRIAASVLLLPLILRMMPAETVGIWTIFMTVTSFIGLLDFGFNPSFTRNITYVFSGVRELKTTGFVQLAEGNNTVDFNLLKGVIDSMRWFYSRVSILLFLLLISFGTYYIHVILLHYPYNHKDIYIAWYLLCIISTYNIYTLYFESLMQGRGLIKRSKQIVIIGQMVYLIFAAVLILLGRGIISIVAAQASSVIIVRVLSYRSFFTAEVRQKLITAISFDKNDILKAIYPNAVKVGLTALGGFAVSRSAIIIGSLYLPLNQIASYGITMQLIGIISSLAAIYTSTYSPKIVHCRVSNDLPTIKHIYIKGQLVLLGTFIGGGFILYGLGEWALLLIGSKTSLMSHSLIAFTLLITFLENNHAVAGTILLTGNEVPFFGASLVAGLVTIVLLLLFLNYTDLSLLGMLLAPGIAHLYNNWKWPHEVRKQLGGISITDYYSIAIANK